MDRRESPGPGLAVPERSAGPAARTVSDPGSPLRVSVGTGGIRVSTRPSSRSPCTRRLYRLPAASWAAQALPISGTSSCSLRPHP
jgi:hypothetical protein